MILLVAGLKIIPDTVQRRDWRKYSKDSLLAGLGNVDWNIEEETVQDYWNVFENKLIGVVDLLIPMSDFVNNAVKMQVPKFIKKKVNLRNNLLKKLKSNPLWISEFV